MVQELKGRKAFFNCHLEAQKGLIFDLFRKGWIVMPRKKRQGSKFNLKPFSPKQLKVLTWWMPGSPYKDWDMVICDGSVRSGKTISMIDGFITWSQANFSGENFILAGKSMGALKRNVLGPMFQLLNLKGIPYSYNRSAEDPHLVIGTNIYYLFGANNERSQDVLQGLTAAGGLLDDAALMPESFVNQAIARCSVEDSKMWLNCNPEGPYHYMNTEMIKKARKKKILHLHFTMEDNLTLSEKTKEKYRRQFTGIFYKRFILGLWVLAEGIIYDMFRDEDHILRNRSVQREILQNVNTRFYISNDYGTGTVFVLGLFAVLQGKRYLVKSFYYDAKKAGRQKTDGEYVDDLKRFMVGFKVNKIIIPDDALSFIAECRKQGITGIKVFQRTPGSVVDGIRKHSSSLANGQYQIFDHSSNKEVIEEYGTYIWDEKKQGKGEDAPVKKGDHGKDMERYFTLEIDKSSIMAA